MTIPIRTLVADCPWPFRDKLPGNGRGAIKHYDLLDLEGIRNFPLPPLADDCRLFLWRVASMQDEALSVARAWGFNLKSEIVWVKLTKHGKLAFGMGRQVRGAHETCLIATRGKPERTGHVRSVFFAKAGRHSEKPEKFYEIVEKISPGPYHELFARRHRHGWTCEGNEIA